MPKLRGTRRTTFVHTGDRHGHRLPDAYLLYRFHTVTHLGEVPMGELREARLRPLDNHRRDDLTTDMPLYGLEDAIHRGRDTPAGRNRGLMKYR